MTSYVIWQQTFSFCCRCTLSGCLLPAVFFGLFCPSPCLADSILPGSLCLVDGHRPGLASSVAPQPEIHLVQSAAVPEIRMGTIGGCRSQDSAVLELVGNKPSGYLGLGKSLNGMKSLSYTSFISSSFKFSMSLHWVKFFQAPLYNL